MNLLCRYGGKSYLKVWPMVKVYSPKKCLLIHESPESELGFACFWDPMPRRKVWRGGEVVGRCIIAYVYFQGALLVWNHVRLNLVSHSLPTMQRTVVLRHTTYTVCSVSIGDCICAPCVVSSAVCSCYTL